MGPQWASTRETESHVKPSRGLPCVSIYLGYKEVPRKESALVVMGLRVPGSVDGRPETQGELKFLFACEGKKKLMVRLTAAVGRRVLSYLEEASPFCSRQGSS